MIDPQITDAIYELVTREDAFDPLLARLARAFDCRSAAIVYLDSARPAATVTRAFGIFSGEAQERYAREFAAIDPAPAALAALPLGEAAATDRLFSEEERQSSRFLRQFYWPLGLREALGAPITKDRRQFGVVAVHRGPDREPFRDEEISAFAEIAAHTARALDLRNRFFRVHNDARVRDDALDASVAAVLAIDESGTVEYANAAARALLAQNDVLILSRSGRLLASDPAANDRLRAFLGSSVGPRVITLPRSKSGQPYALRIRPRSGGLLVQVTDGASPVSDVHDALMQAFALTRPSARLLACFLAGDDLAAAAKKMDISRNTAKFHLRAAFAATGTRRQSELIRRATVVVRDLGF
jgi:GAF domain-containing protein/DNA-binding CsgD family transcriptional regulator